MSGQMRTKRYQVLVERNSEECNFCGNGPDVRQLVIDHRDNDNTNNEYDNLQLLCKRCNRIKKPTVSVDKCVKHQDEETSLSINRKKEPEFRHYVYYRVNKLCGVNRKILINEGSEKFGLSPITIQRYLEKMCSKEGLCKNHFGNISLDMEHPLFKREIPEYDGIWLEKEK